MNDDTHRQPFAVDQHVDFTALDLLAGVVTDLVVSTAPFSADLTDWLLRTAADGLASGPVRSRKAMCKSAQIASQTPSRWNLRKMLQLRGQRCQRRPLRILQITRITLALSPMKPTVLLRPDRCSPSR